MLANIQGIVLAQTNCFILNDENNKGVIIDCDGNGDAVLNYLEENNIIPTHIILTHGHYDHTGAVQRLMKEFPIQLCIGEYETALLGNAALNLSADIGEPREFKADILLKEGETFTVGGMTFHIMHTPGHTEGSICLLIDNYLIAGDTLFAGSCGRCDLPTGDMAKMKASLKRLSLLPKDYTVLPGHGPITTLEHERHHNPYMSGKINFF